MGERVERRGGVVGLVDRCDLKDRRGLRFMYVWVVGGVRKLCDSRARIVRRKKGRVRGRILDCFCYF